MVGGVLIGVAMVDVVRGAEMKSQFGDRFVGKFGEAEDLGSLAVNVGVPFGGCDGAARCEGEVWLVEEKIETSQVKDFSAGCYQISGGH